MHPPEYNLALARAILESLEPFLQSPDPFWQLTSPGGNRSIPFPRLSLGALALTLDEIRAAEDEVEPAVRAAGQAAEREFDRIRQKWTVAVERKALSESSQRLAVWKAYLQDLGDARADPVDYPHEVRQRVILARLLEFARANPDSRGTALAVDTWDGVLRNMFVPGPFVWGILLKTVYPETGFWFLYGTIRN